MHAARQREARNHLWIASSGDRTPISTIWVQRPTLESGQAADARRIDLAVDGRRYD